mmetsp:Transcript_65199/g.178902  ORF Transcript_65199/g.178902 Transcript_65199/m.178902 type:complete len:83 (-) Transcript_65199:89-337(-)
MKTGEGCTCAPHTPALQQLLSRDSFQLSASLDSAHRGLRRADLHLAPRLISLKLGYALRTDGTRAKFRLSVCFQLLETSDTL